MRRPCCSHAEVAARVKRTLRGHMHLFVPALTGTARRRLVTQSMSLILPPIHCYYKQHLLITASKKMWSSIMSFFASFVFNDDASQRQKAGIAEYRR